MKIIIYYKLKMHCKRINYLTLDVIDIINFMLLNKMKKCINIQHKMNIKFKYNAKVYVSLKRKNIWLPTILK